MKDFVMEACTRSALLLDIMYDVNNVKINKKVIEILNNWFTANDLFEKLPAPIPVVKQWVKVTFLNYLLLSNLEGFPFQFNFTFLVSLIVLVLVMVCR